MLKSRTTWPPGGFRFRDAKTGLVLTGALDFKASVYEIIKRRQANPRFGLPTDFDTVANELDAYCCKNMKIPNDPNYCLPVGGSNFPMGLPGSARPVVPARPERSAAAAKFARNAKIGIKTYLDFFGDGSPVKQEVATRRAEVCASCPLNEVGGLLERFTKAAANEIMGIYGVLKDLNCSTPFDEKLHVCSACDCPMKAKVWVKREIILKHMAKDSFDKLVEHCWLRLET